MPINLSTFIKKNESISALQMFLSIGFAVLSRGLEWKIDRDTVAVRQIMDIYTLVAAFHPHPVPQGLTAAAQHL